MCCVFVLFIDGFLWAIATVHVDDLMCTGNEKGQAVFERLRKIFTFRDWKRMMKEWVKFGGRMYWQMEDYSFRISMKFYTDEIRLIKIDPGRDLDQPCSDPEVAELLRVNGQTGWAARQGRQDLAFGVSENQQEVPIATGHTWVKTNKVIRCAHQDQEWRVCSPVDILDALTSVSASDGGSSCGKPCDGSQVGFTAIIAAESILEGEGTVCEPEVLSQRMTRAGRLSMAVEFAAASLAFEHGGCARAMLCEMTEKKFALRDWRRHVARWRQYNVLDAKCAFDSLADEGTASRGLPYQVAGQRRDPRGADAAPMVAEGESRGPSRTGARGAEAIEGKQEG